MNFHYQIFKKEDGLTLLQLLNSFYLAKNRINYLIDNKKISINNEIINKRDHVLSFNDIIDIDTSFYDDIKYRPVRYNLKVIYEDDYILVVDKPKGVIIYDNDITTMANYVAYYYQKTGQDVCVRHVHRLDKDTTGLLVYAKDILTHSYLSHLFENDEIKKEYYAYVEGVLDENGIIDIGISRNRHESGKMMANINGQSAISIYKPIKVINHNTLIDVQIKSGRTHQIRVHMAYIKHPLVGDMLYGNNDGMMYLDCHHIGFYNRLINKYLDLNIPLRFEEGKNEKDL